MWSVPRLLKMTQATDDKGRIFKVGHVVKYNGSEGKSYFGVKYEPCFYEVLKLDRNGYGKLAVCVYSEPRPWKVFGYRPYQRWIMTEYLTILSVREQFLYYTHGSEALINVSLG